MVQAGMNKTQIALIIGFCSLLLTPSFGWSLMGPEGSFSIQQEQFVSPDYNSTQQNSFQSFLLGFNNLEEKNSQFKADLEGKLNPLESSMSYLNIRSLNWQDDQLAIGRKKMQWSQLDEIWQIGFYQPRFLALPLNPETQGLTGAFLNIEEKQWGLGIFASFIYVPDQGPSYEIRDGKFSQSNPWFTAPPKYVRFSGQLDEVNYEIQKPEINDVILNQSYAAHLHFGKKDENLFFQMAWAKKPSQQLALGVDPYFKPDNTALVQVSPKIFIHQLWSADLSYTASSHIWGISGIIEKPQAPLFSEQYSYTSFSDSTSISPYWQFKYKRWDLLASYLKINGGDPQARGGQLLKVYRFDYIDAYLFKLKWQNHELSLKQGAENSFSILQAQSKFKIDQYWNAYAGAQLIAVNQTISNNNQLISKFENHDSLMLGLSYVF
jgi:hypothetical protein